MSEMKSLADQLRSKMAKPDTPGKKKGKDPAEIPPVIELLREFDINGNKTLVHARFDPQTAQLLHHFKMATGIEVTRLICYAVRQLLDKHPEIRVIVREHLNNIDL
jgi:hypothetical protein